MERVPHTAPQFTLDAFNCPHCGAYAKQQWHQLYVHHGERHSKMNPYSASQCAHCQMYAIWKDETLALPNRRCAPLPNPDMPDDVKADYEEADAIANGSPRGAAGLLRLAIQKLCIDLGQPGDNLNQDIAALVETGLPRQVQQALDSVRVIGNEAVHPGIIDIRDNPAIVTQLFKLVNFIVEKMISDPKEIDGIYAALPESKRDQIERRDGAKPR